MIHICDLDEYHVLLDSLNGNPIHYFIDRNGQILVDLNEIAIGMGFNGLADMTRKDPEQLEILAQSINFRDSTEMFMNTSGLMDQYLDRLSQEGPPQPGLLARIGLGKKTRREEG